MAIVSSVVVGSGHKTVGEVTLSVIHGRTIARKRVRTVKNPSTVEQVYSRNRMRNAQLLWKLCRTLVPEGGIAGNPYASTYNRFLTKNLPYMQTPFVASTFPQLLGYYLYNIMPIYCVDSPQNSLMAEYQSDSYGSIVVEWVNFTEVIQPNTFLVVSATDLEGTTLTGSLYLQQADIDAGYAVVETGSSLQAIYIKVGLSTVDLEYNLYPPVYFASSSTVSIPVSWFPK